jgi:hypothetical protein
MITLIAKISVDVDSFSDWLVVLKVFSLWASVCAILGAVVGYLCRGRVGLEIFLSFVVSLAYGVCLEWTSPLRSQEWSWQNPIESAMYLVGPFVYFLFVPAVIAALLVGRWSQRRHAR